MGTTTGGKTTAEIYQSTHKENQKTGMISRQAAEGD